MTRAIFTAFLLLSAAIPAFAESGKFDVKFSASHSITESGKLLIQGSTNLPDGTNITASLSHAHYYFSGGSEAVVSGGKFALKPIGAKNGLPPGVYELLVGTGSSFNQPDHVKKLIGERGLRMKGPNVEITSWNLGFARVKSEISLGSKEEADKYHELMQARAAGVRGSIRDLVERGIKMEHIRYGQDLESARQCGISMRSNQAEAKKVEERAKKLPQAFFMLRLAASYDLQLCVSCSRSSAIEACDRVVENLERKDP